MAAADTTSTAMSSSSGKSMRLRFKGDKVGVLSRGQREHLSFDLDCTADDILANRSRKRRKRRAAQENVSTTRQIVGMANRTWAMWKATRKVRECSFEIRVR